MNISIKNVNLILRFNSHPVADLVNQSVKFKIRKLRIDAGNYIPATCIKHVFNEYLKSYDDEIESFVFEFNEEYFMNIRNGLRLFDDGWENVFH